MYNCNEAMYNKAEIYYKAATNLKDNGFINEVLIIEVQIAIENIGYAIPYALA